MDRLTWKVKKKEGVDLLCVKCHNAAPLLTESIFIYIGASDSELWSKSNLLVLIYPAHRCPPKPRAPKKRCSYKRKQQETNLEKN